MFLRCKVRRKDGKQHRYWSVVENTRVGGGRVVQRHVLYLGEINDTQELAWRRSIEVLEDGGARPRTLSLFPEDRVEGLLADASVVGVRLSELRLRRALLRINSRAQSDPRSHIYVRRTYSGRPSSSMRFSEAAAMATSVVCRPSVRERSASPITRL